SSLGPFFPKHTRLHASCTSGFSAVNTNSTANPYTSTHTHTHRPTHQHTHTPNTHPHTHTHTHCMTQCVYIPRVLHPLYVCFAVALIPSLISHCVLQEMVAIQGKRVNWYVYGLFYLQTFWAGISGLLPSIV